MAPSTLLGLALHRAEIDLQTIGIEVDLHAVLRDEQADLEPLHNWAGKRLHSDPGGSGIARLNHATMFPGGHLARLTYVEAGELRAALRDVLNGPTPT